MSERNRPTPEGRAIGLIAARVADDAEPAVRAAMPSLPERCKSCAFREGSFPNGCVETILDAMGCAISGEPFYCHHKFAPDGTPLELCAGWMVAIGNVPPVVARAFTPAINALNFENGEWPKLMTDAQIIALAADRTAESLFRFARGEIDGTEGRPIAREAEEAVLQAAGAFQHFAAQVRIGIAENAEPKPYGDETIL